MKKLTRVHRSIPSCGRLTELTRVSIFVAMLAKEKETMPQPSLYLGGATRSAARASICIDFMRERLPKAPEAKRNSDPLFHAIPSVVEADIWLRMASAR